MTSIQSPSNSSESPRGRPRIAKEDSIAKSDALRAREYRDRIKISGKSSVRLQNNSVELLRLQEEIDIQKKVLDQIKKDLGAVTGMLDLFIKSRQSQKALPKDVFVNICKSHLSVTIRHDFL